MKELEAIPGVFDILPCDHKEIWRSSFLWQHVENAAKEMARRYGFKEIRTPILEKTELFERGVGEGTDIVSKEMYTFTDRGERSVTLRPEGTASVMRAYLEHSLYQEGGVQKFFYLAPMFRYERAQAGRYRQHHQLGMEAVGSSSFLQDGEMIALLWNFYKVLGISEVSLYINSIGDKTCRIEFRKALTEYLETFKEELSEDSKKRLIQNPLRILDSKDPKDQKIIEKAPSILDFLSPSSLSHFEGVKSVLTSLNIPFSISSKLVRGLDYYNDTVFEIVAGSLGAQNSIGGGGRYDTLIESLGGNATPAFGFGTGIERVIQTLVKQSKEVPVDKGPVLFLIPLFEAEEKEKKMKVFSLLEEVRQSGLSAIMDYSERKLAKSMQSADKMGAEYVLVIGENELTSGKAQIKNMKTGEKEELLLSSLIPFLKGKMKHA